MSHVTPILWRDGVLELLDQRRLPHEVIWVPCRTPSEVTAAIRDMVVRGAPAIGVCAGFGMALAVPGGESNVDGAIRAAAEELRGARPTAVNLGWAIDRMLGVYESVESLDARAIRERLEQEAKRMFDEDVEANRRIGKFGADLLSEEATVLTHCNAGALATAGYGTALGVIRAAHDGGKKIAVYADETRPYLQGARLTAWELQEDGIDVTLITDNMSGHFFAGGAIDAVVVGADRIAANGDAANKIGTYTLAVLANAHGVPFYVAAPVSTIDFDCPDGSKIPIEERSADEVTQASGRDADGSIRTVSIAPAGVRVRHPAFDVTPAKLITAIITDQGVLRAPYADAIRALRG